MDLKEMAALFEEPQKCYGHCDQPASLKVLRENGMLLVGFACHAGYVSRIAAYGREIDLEGFKMFIADSLGRKMKLTDSDLRTATRFSWDLGVKEGGGGEVMKAAYWTQNYRGSKKDDPRREGLFVCANCVSLFVQPIDQRSVLCENCRSQS